MQRVTHASAKAFLIRKFQTLLGSALNASAYTDRGVSENLGYLIWDPYSKDPTI